jgi:hypothetical protein
MSGALENRFAKAMATIGGVRPASIDAACTTGLNADFVFPRDDVIAELKCLEEDPRDHGDFTTKVARLYAGWVRKGLVTQPSSGTLKIDTNTLPKVCQREFLKFVGAGIQAHAKKANVQIRETKKSLKMPNAKGLLLLCNTGNRFLEPPAIGYFVWRALGHQLSSINTLIIFSFGIGHSAPGVPLPIDFWVPSTRDNGADVPNEFLDRVRDAWMQEASAGQVLFEIPGNKDLLNQIKAPPRQSPSARA